MKLDISEETKGIGEKMGTKEFFKTTNSISSPSNHNFTEAIAVECLSFAGMTVFLALGPRNREPEGLSNCS